VEPKFLFRFVQKVYSDPTVAVIGLPNGSNSTAQDRVREVPSITHFLQLGNQLSGI
jgi:hypothetical protein